MQKKRKYTWRDKPKKEVSVIEEQVVPVQEEPSPPVEEKIVLCECGKRANPGDHQCWGCSHRT